MKDQTFVAVERPDHLHLYEIAAEQHGYFTAAQARACGFSSRLLAHHVAGGRYERIRWGLYRLRAYPSGPHDEVMAAWLAVGKELAVVSHDSALDLLDLSDVIPDAVHLTVPRARRKFRPLPGTVVHTTTRPFGTGDLTEREGIRLTAPARTILDAAEIGVGPEQIELAIRQATERGLVDLRALRRDGRARGGRVARLIAQGVAAAGIARLAARLADEGRAPLIERLAELLDQHNLDPLSPEAERLGRVVAGAGETEQGRSPASVRVVGTPRASSGLDTRR
jgi:predicted transcriptional regulator of viral defense system